MKKRHTACEACLYAKIVLRNHSLSSAQRRATKHANTKRVKVGFVAPLAQNSRWGSLSSKNHSLQTSKLSFIASTTTYITDNAGNSLLLSQKSHSSLLLCSQPPFFHIPKVASQSFSLLLRNSIIDLRTSHHHNSLRGRSGRQGRGGGGADLSERYNPPVRYAAAAAEAENRSPPQPPHAKATFYSMCCSTYTGTSLLALSPPLGDVY